MDLIGVCRGGAPARGSVRPVAVTAGRAAVDGHAVDGGDAVSGAGVHVHGTAAATAVIGRRGRRDGVRGVHGDQGGRDGLDAVAA